MTGRGLDHVLARVLQDWITNTARNVRPELYAKQITSLCDVDDVEDFCWTLWQAFIDAAQKPSIKTERQIDRLVQLVKAIREADPLLDKNGKVATCWDGQCWKDLPLLGPQMRENWNTSRKFWSLQEVRPQLLSPTRLGSP